MFCYAVKRSTKVVGTVCEMMCKTSCSRCDGHMIVYCSVVESRRPVLHADSGSRKNDEFSWSVLLVPAML